MWGGKLLGPLVKDLLQCERCGVYRKQHIPSTKQLYRLLENMILGACYQKDKELERLQVASWQLDWLEKYVTRGCLYDVGAAAGFFMKAAKERGWRVRGNDLSKAAIVWAKEHYDLEIDYGFLEELNLPPKTFDAVTLWHTLEHTRDPVQTLTVCRKILKDQGVLMIGIPEKNHGDLHRYYEKLHLYEFNRNNLGALLTQLGFQLLELRENQNYIPEISLICRKGH